MVDLIKPSELPPATQAYSDSELIIEDAGAVKKATAKMIADAGAPVATEAQALAGSNNERRMTPLRVKQVLDSAVAPSVLRAQEWAESTTNPDPSNPDSKSAKTWAGIAEDAALDLAPVVGTWNPNAEGSTTAGTVSIFNRQGTYYKIGKMVFFQGFINFNTLTGTGDLLISGLPFNSKTSIAPGGYIVDIATSSMSFSGTIVARIGQNTNKISIMYFASGGSLTPLHVVASGIIQVTGFYEVA